MATNLDGFKKELGKDMKNKAINGYILSIYFPWRITIPAAEGGIILFSLLLDFQ